MSNSICTGCRSSLRRALRAQYLQSNLFAQTYISSSSTPNTAQPETSLPSSEIEGPISTSHGDRVGWKAIGLKTDIAALLRKPSWSIRSLLPDQVDSIKEEISPKQLHHLLRLSALPLPESPEAEASMLSTLHQQLHFVRNIQDVNTDGVEPLQRIADETEAGNKELTIGLDSVKSALQKEEIIGRMRRPRRKRDEGIEMQRTKDWDVLGTANEKIEVPGLGKFFVVRSGTE